MSAIRTALIHYNRKKLDECVGINKMDLLLYILLDMMLYFCCFNTEEGKICFTMVFYRGAKKNFEKASLVKISDSILADGNNIKNLSPSAI